MMRFLCILPIFLAIGTIQAQLLQEPCEIQARMQHGICFDPPGCIVLSPTAFTGATPPFQYLWDTGHT